MEGSVIVENVDPNLLLNHPDQDGIYGGVGGEHDSQYADLLKSVHKDGVTHPLHVSRGTPDLPDQTIISGHRRAQAAIENYRNKVPVIYVAYESAVHAREALLTSNKTREKDEWVKTQEARAWWEVEAALAALREKAGRRNPEAKLPQGRAPQTRDAVATRLGESGKTTELRKKLADEARKQNPEDPSASVVAQDLKGNMPVHTVAKKHGLISSPEPKPKNMPNSAQNSTETTRAKKPAPAPRKPSAPVDEQAVRTRAWVRACHEFDQRTRELLHDDPLATLSDESLRNDCEAAIQMVLGNLEERRRSLQRRPTLSVVK